MFDPSSIHNSVKKIQKQSLELDELHKELKTKCNKKGCDPKFPPNINTEKPNKVELEEI